jgi:hypothetical protein
MSCGFSIPRRECGTQSTAGVPARGQRRDSSVYVEASSLHRVALPGAARHRSLPLLVSVQGCAWRTGSFFVFGGYGERDAAVTAWGAALADARVCVC